MAGGAVGGALDLGVLPDLGRHLVVLALEPGSGGQARRLTLRHGGPADFIATGVLDQEGLDGLAGLSVQASIVAIMVVELGHDLMPGLGMEQGGRIGQMTGTAFRFKGGWGAGWDHQLVCLDGQGQYP